MDDRKNNLDTLIKSTSPKQKNRHEEAFRIMDEWFGENAIESLTDKDVEEETIFEKRNDSKKRRTPSS